MRTFVLPTSFISSPETEKERLLYASESVACGFYTKFGFIISPKPIEKYKNYCVVIPEVIKKVSQEYWQDAASGGVLMPKKISQLMYNELDSLELSPVDINILNKFKYNWSSVEEKAWKCILDYFPNEIKWVKSLEVRVTKIGSIGSHYLLIKKPKQHLIINIREDSNYLDIINLLVLSLIFPLANELGLSFTHRQTLRNFILSRQPFQSIYPNFEPKTFDNPKIPVFLKNKSYEYINYLGIPNIIDPIPILNKNMHSFGVKEEKLLNLLIKNRNELVSYDQIADVIWGEGKFKSYWAISKIMQRIQKKIDKLNILLKITGVRGKGYILK